MRMSRKFGALCVAILAAWMLGPALAAEEQPACTVTVRADQSIQQAIDEAAAGDVLCLADGEWNENLIIEKSITILGPGDERSVIRGQDDGRPVIEIRAPDRDTEVVVVLRGLAVFGGKCDQGDGIVVGNSVQAEITCSTISGNATGISVRGTADATIQRNRILDNRSYGVALYEEPCAETQAMFIGRVAGYCNTIRRPGEPQANEKGAVCPDVLGFLSTEKGGEYIRRGLQLSSTDGGRVIEPGEGLYAYELGTKVTVRAEADESYRFIGWSGDTGALADPKAASTTVTMDDHYSLEARFEPRTYTIKATADEGGTIKPSGLVQVKHGADQTFTITPDEGRLIKDVLVDGRSVGAKETYTFTDVRRDHAIHAEFCRVQRHLEVSSTDGGKVTDPGEGKFTYGHSSTVQLRAEADRGYKFVGWSGDTHAIADPKAARTTITMGADHKIVAEFEPLRHTLDVSSTAGGEVFVPREGSHTFDHGEKVELFAEADCGYRFVRWEGDISTIADPNAAHTTITMHGDYAIVAVFEQITYTITATAGEGGSIYPEGKIEVGFRANQTFTITPDTCYRIADVLVNGESVGAVEEYTFRDVYGEHTIHAEFQPGDVVQPGESIQKAIDRASPGDVICLAPGEWTENIHINKSVTLHGAGAERTIIRSAKDDIPVVRIDSDGAEHAPHITLGGIQVTGARGDEGYGIMVAGRAQATIRHCIITDNKTGIMLWMRARATIEDNVVSDNQRHGIVLSFYAEGTINRNHILRNRRYGVALYPRPSYDIDGITFSGYVAGGRNTIPGPDEPDANKDGAIPPCYLGFLMTEEGGEMDNRRR